MAWRVTEIEPEKAEPGRVVLWVHTAERSGPRYKLEWVGEGEPPKRKEDA